MKKNLPKVLLALVLLAALLQACGGAAGTANISAAQMVRDEMATQPISTFSPTDVFYVNIDLRNAPDDTIVKAVWTAVQVEGADPNITIEETELESGSGKINFQLSNSQPWPVGEYKVDLYLDDVLSRTVEFSVE